MSLRSIEQRIFFHEKEQRKLNDVKIQLEMELGKVNGKIVTHWAAIQNLERKKKVKL